MYIFTLRTFIVLALAMAAAPRLAGAESKVSSWHLPQNLTDSNTTIGFEVDTTWHMVHGKTSEISGNARLPNPADPTTIDILVELPAAKLDTADADRDEELRQVIAAAEFPKIRLNVSGAKLRCTPAATVERGECADTLQAELQIRSTRSSVAIPIVIRAESGGFIVSGSFRIKWADYGVEDPSIFLVATVDPVVEIHFRVLLAPDPKG